jgi:pSer/pThr/pTyr-binding forkhead associated (FHA) protein
MGQFGRFGGEDTRMRRPAVTLFRDRADHGHVAARSACAIGSHASNDLRIDDDTVSRLHCELAIAGSAVCARDLGSL